MDFPIALAPLIAAATDGSAWPAGNAVGALGRGILLGVGAALPIGPVNVEIARRVLRTGFATGVALGCGAVTVDVAYAVLSTLSIARLLNQPAFVLPVAALGALLLTFLGVQCLRAAAVAYRHDPLADALDDVPEDDVPEAEADENPSDENLSADARHARAGNEAVRTAYATGLLMTLLNPMTLVFWFTVVPATGFGLAGVPQATADGAAPGAAAPPGNELPMLCVGVFVGTVAWVFAFAGLMATARRAAGRNEARRRRWLALADACGGIALLIFACLAGAEFWRRISPLI